MTEMLLNILKDPKYIKCWYPCSGDDFEVTKIFTENNGNTIIPNLFILTDSNLIQILNAHNCVTRPVVGTIIKIFFFVLFNNSSIK